MIRNSVDWHEQARRWQQKCKSCGGNLTPHGSRGDICAQVACERFDLTQTQIMRKYTPIPEDGNS